MSEQYKSDFSVRLWTNRKADVLHRLYGCFFCGLSNKRAVRLVSGSTNANGIERYGFAQLGKCRFKNIPNIFSVIPPIIWEDDLTV